MKVMIQKWGDSLGIHISAALAANFHVGDEVELSLVEGNLFIASVNSREPEYRLEDLLAQVTDDNLHGECWQ